MSRLISIIIFLFFVLYPVFSQHHKITGQLVDSKNKPIGLATVIIPDNEVWTITDEFGKFTLNNIPVGKVSIIAHCLGYATKKSELEVKSDIADLVIHLSEDNLALEEVVVTAQRKAGEQTTSYLIDRTTLDHAQVLNVTDITSLLPGGKTRKSNSLAQENDDRFALRSGGSSEMGNPSFGTAVEVDGIRLDNNSAMSVGAVKYNDNINETKGVSTRNVSTTNIESIEIITGIPSVEYGDLSNGVVKINTRKGKTPYYIEFSTEPHTKQYSASKGFALGKEAGVLNTSFEHTKSNSDLASPYTTYQRNVFSLNYNKTLNQSRQQPIMLTAGFTGNIGGYNSKEDPDNFKNDYIKSRDNTFRGNFKLNWLLNQSWITNMEISGSFSYSDKLKKKNQATDSGASQPAIHGLEEGYFLSTNYDNNPNAPIIQAPTGYWDVLRYTDNKPINYSLKIKADWVRKFGNISNKVLIGTDFKSSGNEGKGVYYDDMRLAPTWREYRYKDLPYINNIAIYAEDRLTLPVTDISMLQLTAGMRSDITSIGQSEYGTVSSISPRLKGKYTFWEKSEKAVKDLSLHIGWGKAVKLPSFEVLYPSPTYIDTNVFETSVSQGENNPEEKIYGYYIIPQKAFYNPNLKWQHSQQFELGVETNILGAQVELSAFYNKTINPYLDINVYTPYSYKRIEKDALNNSQIVNSDRIFSIDQATGIVTVSDKNAILPSQQLAYITREDYKMNTMYSNGSDVKRYGVEWIIDFPKIQALRTSIRLDGNYYRYKGVEETLYAYKGPDQMNDYKTPYRYIGYYTGASGNNETSVVKNGNLTKSVNSNLTITTHIPKIRLIIMMKIEASFYNYSQGLSEYNGEKRGFVLEDGDTYRENTSNIDIYGGDRNVAVYPLFYSTWDAPDIKIPFTEAYKEAKENDPELFKELSKLIMETNYKTSFNPNKISSYFSANISITKEIGSFAAISFYANNFFNSMARVKSSKENTESSLYNSSYIPKFYYGLSLKLKI